VSATVLAHFVVTYVLVATLLLAVADGATSPARTLLLAYLALSLPVYGAELGLALRQYPVLRNVVLRLLEPLAAPIDDEDVARGGPVENDPATDGVEIVLSDVTALAGGHPILDHIDLHIAPGSHVAVVGASGAGKSSLVHLLLGWHRPASGSLLVNGQVVRGDELDRIRRTTVWIDPGVQLWNSSLDLNLRYGATGDPPMDEVLRKAGLVALADNLPAGLQTALGEGGGLVSGGEGQRVRLGRALHRPAARLVLLDEPFRGIERSERAALLDSARRRWRNATLLCATHDIDQTRTFDRVLVLDGGRIVEDGSPAELAAAPGSRYRELLADDEAVRAGFAGERWRRLRLTAGAIVGS
jgi:ATP-binding cassette subfamily B protein